MAERKRKVVSNDVKQNAIEKVRAGQRRADVAKEIGVSLATIQAWLSAARGQGSTAPLRKTEVAVILPTEPMHEKEETMLLRWENEYLKKKVAYFENRST